MENICLDKVYLRYSLKRNYVLFQGLLNETSTFVGMPTFGIFASEQVLWKPLLIMPIFLKAAIVLKVNSYRFKVFTKMHVQLQNEPLKEAGIPKVKIF